MVTVVVETFVDVDEVTVVTSVVVEEEEVSMEVIVEAAAAFAGTAVAAIEVEEASVVTEAEAFVVDVVVP